MSITPVHNVNNNNIKSYNNQISFGHNSQEAFWKSDYSTKDKLVVAGTTALGVVASLAALAKIQGHSVKPKSFFKYLKTAPIKFKEVVSMGIGTCLGGLAGGYIIDNNPENRKAKQREAVMQIGNISIPIATVALTDILCNTIKVSKETLKGKAIRTFTSLSAIIAGIYIANYAMNKLSNMIFNSNIEGRGVKTTDLFPHIDDVLASGEYILPNNKFVRKISRIVPFALMVPGNEIGNKKA